MAELSLAASINLLNYNYSVPYSQRERLYRQIIDKLYPDLVSSPASFVGNSESPTPIFSASQPSLRQNGFQYLPQLELDFVEYVNRIVDTKFSLVSGHKMTVDPAYLHSCKPLLELFSSKEIINPIADYLGVFPSIQYFSLWRTRGNSKLERTNEMHWHMDHHGHRFVKVFYYLSETRLGYGHHEFILDTHYQPNFDQLLEHHNQNLRDAIFKKRVKRGRYHLPDDIILPLTSSLVSPVGKAGLGFMEDTRGLHRGTVVPPDHERTILQSVYVPFDSCKDEKHCVPIDSNFRQQLISQSGFSNRQLNKLFELISS